MKPARDPLDPLLDRWRSEIPPASASADLPREVWRRIADAEVSALEPGLIARIESVFQRPSFAFAFIAACTLFGLFLAEIRVSRQQAQRNLQLAQAYVQLIDPLLQETSTADTRTP